LDLLGWAVALASVSLGLTLYGAASWRLGQGRAAGEGGLPGYAWYPGEAVSLEALDAEGAGLEVASLEALHGGARSRLVLRVRAGGALPAGPARGAVLMALARRALERSGADVVAVELSQEPEEALGHAEDEVWLVSADGAGWGGARRGGYGQG
jgi:hypothetical protein